MTDDSHNPNDPAFLLSRSLDEPLSGKDRQRLDDALAASPALRTEADRYRALHDLIYRWTHQNVELDWDAQADATLARIAATEEGEVADRCDEALVLWSHREPAVDWHEFTDGVMAAVKTDTPRHVWRTWLFRAAPLAAAAAIFFAVGPMWWAAPRVDVRWATPIVSTVQPDEMPAARKSIVSFGHDPVDPAPTAHAERRVSFLMVGSDPANKPIGEMYPL